MFTAIATQSGWTVYRNGNPVALTTFDHLASVKKTIEKIGGTLIVVINGYAL